jgi:hypothetical protein
MLRALHEADVRPDVLVGTPVDAGRHRRTETFTVTVDDGATLGPFPAGTPAEPNVAAFETTGTLALADRHRRRVP